MRNAKTGHNSKKRILRTIQHSKNAKPMESTLNTPEQEVFLKRRLLANTSEKRRIKTKQEVNPAVSFFDQTSKNQPVVNYLNGVPMSILLNQTASIQKDASWKQNMLRRNDALQSTDIVRSHQRNEIEKKNLSQNLGQYLPQIGKGKIQPNYYKNKRKQNYTNIYENNEGQVLPQSAGGAFSDANANVLKKINASFDFSKDSEQAFSNFNSKKRADSPPKNKPIKEERRAESMYVPKRNKVKSRSKSRISKEKRTQADSS